MDQQQQKEFDALPEHTKLIVETLANELVQHVMRQVTVLTYATASQILNRLPGAVDREILDQRLR